MEKPDGRHLSIAAQNYLRQQAIGLRAPGKRVCDISEYLGVNRSTVGKWWRQYKMTGTTALSQQRRGRQLGEGQVLGASAQAAVEAALHEELEAYGIDSAL